MLHENFAIIGAVITSIGGILYLIDTIKGKVKPNKVTWFLWALAPLIAFSAQISQGVGITSLVTFATGFMPLVIFVASFFNKKSEWSLTRFDFICGALSIFGLVLWLITKTGNVAILFSIVADALAAVPTVVKSYRAPETEAANIYLLNGLGVVITLLTIDTWDFAHFAFPVYILLVCSLIFALVKFRIGKRLVK